MRFEFASPAWNELPALLSETAYQNPMDASHTALQRAFKSPGIHMFGLMQKQPGVFKAFNTYMSVQREGRPNFADFFPVERQLIDGLSGAPNAVLFVDVGGGQGQEIVELRRKLPTLPGRTILQDLPEIIQATPKSKDMEATEHNFFEPQPIRGKYILPECTTSSH